MLVQQLFNGAVTGASYALFALGLTLIFGMHRILNFAHGAVFMWGALIGLYAVLYAGLSLPLAFLCGILGGAFVSVMLDLLVFRPLRRRHGDELSTIVASIGASLVLLNGAQQLTGADTLRYPFGVFPLAFYQLGGVKVSSEQIVILLTVAVLLIALVIYLYRTPLGIEVRAVSVDEKTSTLLGVRPGRVYFQTFALTGALAGAAGVILGITFNSVSYTMGEGIMLQGFVVIILGGLGSIPGTVIASLIIGVVQSLTVAYVSTELSDAILFGILFVILMVRPNGFFSGLHVEHRVA
ncbi:MAG TPA: branched-chain amino acid ABC transporter permease [Hyphomicrobiales bacterium]|nr:branched-chain amino acid ABC transporter permease [Hyphomicrobiales bacterium]